MEFLKQIQIITYVYDIPDEQQCVIYQIMKTDIFAINIMVAVKILTNVKRFRMRGRKHVSKYSYL